MIRLAPVLAAALLLAGPARAQSDEGTFPGIPRLVATGSASEERVPDRASVSLEVEASGPTPDRVTQDIAAAANRVAKVLAEAGIPDPDIRSEGPSIEAVYETVRDERGQEIRERRRQTGFRGRYTLVVRVGPPDRVQTLVPRIAAAGGQVSGIAFEVSDRAARLQALEEKAVADAVAKARRLIEAAGAKPGRILSIADPNANVQYDMPVRRSAPGAGPAEVTLPVRPGRQELAASVKVTMEILAP